ncbi:MAG: pimeloyl-ACP methyl ester esterase BioH [Paraglaciecola sp.]|nr:pimeloyl-ACP methyl ester esterase BioH [Paraglaciecola sp.]
MPERLKISTVGSGKQLVFLHGWGVNSGVWQPLIDIIKDDFCVTTIDLPGYGLNQQTLPTPYNLHNIANTVAKHISPDSILIGWSLGGLVAQKIADLYPDKLRQLVLICSSPKFSKSTDWYGIEPKVLRFFTQLLKQDPAKTLQRFLAIQAMGSKHARQEIQIIKQAVQRYPIPSTFALSSGLDMLQNIDLREVFKTLSVPCHMFFGRLDTLVPDTVLPSIGQLNCKVTIEVIVDASHAPFISNPEEFAKRLMKAMI